MKAELQHKEPQKADPIQSKRERSKLSFVDNRLQTVSLMKLINSIQKKENKKTELSNKVIQRFLYIGKGVTEKVSPDFYVIDEDEDDYDGPWKKNALISFLDNIKKAGLFNYFTNNILKQRSYQLRLDAWEQLTVDRIREHKRNEESEPIKIEDFNSPLDKLYGIHDVRSVVNSEGYQEETRTNVGRAPQIEKLNSTSLTDNFITIDVLNNALGITTGDRRIYDSGSLQGEVKKYHDFLSQHPLYTPAFKNVANDVKKSCKAGIVFTNINNGIIHFELSGIDMAKVVTKEDSSITGSELRSIYRIINYGGKSDCTFNPDKVKFYLKGNLVQSPWDSDPDLWAKYLSKRSHSE